MHIYRATPRIERRKLTRVHYPENIGPIAERASRLAVATANCVVILRRRSKGLTTNHLTVLDLNDRIFFSISQSTKLFNRKLRECITLTDDPCYPRRRVVAKLDHEMSLVRHRDDAGAAIGRFESSARHVFRFPPHGLLLCVGGGGPPVRWGRESDGL